MVIYDYLVAAVITTVSFVVWKPVSYNDDLEISGHIPRRHRQIFSVCYDKHNQHNNVSKLPPVEKSCHRRVEEPAEESPSSEGDRDSWKEHTSARRKLSSSLSVLAWCRLSEL